MITASFLSLRRQALEKQYIKLNAMQREAVLSTEGPLLVLAGAGSGKTTVIVNRIAHLIQYGGAFHSDVCDPFCAAPSEADENALRAYLEKGDAIPAETASKLSVSAPKPWQILAITFTNKAASELKNRLEAKVGEDARDIWAGTFHSTCVRILRRYAKMISYSSNFTIYDTDDSRRVMKEALRSLGVNEKNFTPKTVLAEISRAKDELLTPKSYSEKYKGDFHKKTIAELYRYYQQTLRQADAMDFDDLICNTVRLLQRQPEVLEYYTNRFRYVLVDEYQDTNYAQYCLTSLLASGHKNLCVVGDDDQSIYRFRGATVENILQFEEQYTNAKVIRLEENYRSTKRILAAANAVIAHNHMRKGKNLWTNGEQGERIFLCRAEDEREEGKFIAKTILSQKAAGAKWSDHAVLYRMNSQSNAVEQALVRSAVPYRIIGGHRFYERKEIKDALAYLTVLVNPSDAVRLRRIINEPKRGIGEATVALVSDLAREQGVSALSIMQAAETYPELSRSAAKLKEFCGMMNGLRADMAVLPLHELLEKVLQVSGYYNLLAADKETQSDRTANLSELANNLLRYSTENEKGDLNGFLQEVALLSDIDNYNAEADTVVLMTLHSAKGLEFPTVFIAGIEDGVFPGKQALYYPEDMEEERRLAYVGITRAKSRLYLCTAEMRMLFGSTTYNPPSRFIKEIPEELLESICTEQKPVPRKSTFQKSAAPQKAATVQKYKKEPQVKAAQHQIGDTVVHKTFGTGIVLSCKAMGNDTLLEIAFSRAGTKKLMANYAKLEKPE